MPVEEGRRVPIHSHERVDDLQRSGLRIIQNPSSFRFSTDAVLLAEFATVKQGDICLDLGTGTGVIPLLLAARHSGLHITGIEIIPDMADMAARSVALNGLEDVIRICCADLRQVADTFGKASFDVVVSNPPYIEAGRGAINPGGALSVARHEIACTLQDVVRTASVALRSNGRFAMVHRPQRLSDIIATMRTWCIEPKRLRMVQTRQESPPVMVLVEGAKQGKATLEVLPTLVLYQGDGDYTEEAKRIYYGRAT